MWVSHHSDSYICTERDKKFSWMQLYCQLTSIISVAQLLGEILLIAAIAALS